MKIIQQHGQAKVLPACAKINRRHVSFPAGKFDNSEEMRENIPVLYTVGIPFWNMNSSVWTVWVAQGSQGKSQLSTYFSFSSIFHRKKYILYCSIHSKQLHNISVMKFFFGSKQATNWDSNRECKRKSNFLEQLCIELGKIYCCFA